jgi:RND superfamily putative drug exporter
MSALLARIARSLTAHWVRGLIGLVVALVVIGIAIGSQNGSAADDFSIPGTESQKALDLLEAKFPTQAGAESTIVFTSQDGKLTDPQEKQTVESALAAVAKLPHVAKDGVESPLAPDSPALSDDGKTGFATVKYDKQSIDLDKEDGDKLIDTAEQANANGVHVELRGEVVDLSTQEVGGYGEIVGLGIAFILLWLLYRSFSAMIVTLLGAVIGVAISQMIILAVQKPLGLPEFTHTLALMLGLGAGIDYSLLIVSRFREQLAAGDAAPEAASRANATSGVSVVAAGVIVMVAIAALLTVGIPLVGKMGIGTAIAVACVVVSSISVLPIFLGAFKRWMSPKDPEHVARSEAFTRWGQRLTARPWLAVIAGGLVLIVIAIPFTDMRLGQPDDGNQSTSTTQRQAYDELSEAFGPGFNGPLILAVGSKDGGKLDPQSLDSLKGSLEDVQGVESVGAPATNDAGDAAVIRVTPTTSPQDEQTTKLVDRLRDDVLPRDTADTNLQVYVGGQTAAFEDFSAKVSGRLALFILVVIGLSMILLMAVFRSILVPLASAVFNLLSIGAAYGVVVAVFQWGWGASLIGASSDVPIISFIPLMMFAILFGLSMDYNVFLLSRIREAYFEGDSPSESVVHGLSRIAKVILVAGLVMSSVFLAFIIGGDTITKMFGVGLGAAILIDVLVVRMVVSPALMTLLGDKAWWMPRWLDRIVPNVSLEGGHDSRAKAVEERELANV